MALLTEEYLDKLDEVLADAFRQPLLSSLLIDPHGFRAIRDADASFNAYRPLPVTTTTGHSYAGVPIVVDPTLEPGEIRVVSPEFSRLISKSEMTIADHMTEQTDMRATIELLVELDRRMAQHGGRFDEPVECQEAVNGTPFGANRQLYGSHADIEAGALMIPDGIYLDGIGQVLFLMQVPPEQEPQLVFYVGLTLDNLEDAFPAVALDLKQVCADATGKTLSTFLAETRQRLRGKPTLNAMVQDELKTGRLVVADLKREQAENDAANFYGKKNDYGTF